MNAMGGLAVLGRFSRWYSLREVDVTRRTVRLILMTDVHGTHMEPPDRLESGDTPNRSSNHSAYVLIESRDLRMHQHIAAIRQRRQVALRQSPHEVTDPPQRLRRQSGKERIRQGETVNDGDV